ncbi:MAG: polymer-forming cytoskeletal protein [Thermoanaerobaculia bacterium]
MALLPLFAVLILGCASLASAADSSAAPASLGDRIHERFRVWVEDETIRLRPIEGDPAIRSIALEDDEAEAAVNGKAFTGDELRAFLGKDGELIAELAALDGDGRRAALGIEDDEPQERKEAAGGLAAGPPASGAPPIPPIPPIPGIGRVRVESDGDDRVSFGRSIEIGPEETTGDAVCIGCSITVLGEVSGDAVAVGGSVHVESSGHVNGNAVAVGGKVRLDAGATVEGDAVAIGGTVQAEEGATVEGQRSSVGWGKGWNHKGNGVNLGWPFWFDSDAGELFWGILRALFLLLLCCISVLLARGTLERTSRRLAEEPWKALFAGLLTQLLFFPVLLFVTVILAVSIVGIPLLVLVPVAVLALLVAMLLGFAAVAQSLGRWAAQRFGWNLTEPFLPVVVGVAMIQGLTILARIIGLPGGFLGLVAFALVAFGFCLKYAAWTMGLGAMTLSLLGRDWRRPVSGPERPELRTPLAESMAEAAMPLPPPPPAASAEAAPAVDGPPEGASAAGKRPPAPKAGDEAV